MRSQDKVAIITGGSTGIGKAIASTFFRQGMHVIINGRREDVLLQTAREIDPSGTRVSIVAGHIADPRTAERLVQEAVDRFGRLDTLVNNAGIFISKPFTDIRIEDFESVISTNVAGFFYVTQLALKVMEPAGSGHIVNITASGVAEQPIKAVPSVLAALSKGGLNTATKSLALEYADKGIRVNAVAPGVVKTPMHTEESYAFLSQMHPMGRLGEADEIAEAVAYLETARFVTGEILHVDGGQNSGRW